MATLAGELSPYEDHVHDVDDTIAVEIARVRKANVGNRNGAGDTRSLQAVFANRGPPKLRSSHFSGRGPKVRGGLEPNQLPEMPA